MNKSKDDFLLAVYDITGIQDYIFASNRMKENMGGSYIVGRMVEYHFVKVLKHCAIKKNGTPQVYVCWDKNSQEVKILKDASKQAEVVYIGGGNALVIYRDWELYHKVNRAFALKVLEESASLTMATEAIPFSVTKTEDDKTKKIIFEESNGRSYQQMYQELMQKLSETKAKQLRTKLNQTLPIFAQEPFKGNPITHKVREVGTFIEQDSKQPVSNNATPITYEHISTEQRLKIKATKGNTVFKRYDDRFEKETIDLKRVVGEDSYIAVVHIDGNGMGDWIKTELKKTEGDLVADIRKHRKLSENITELFRGIFGQALDEFKKDKLPMRPLILDGDDVTFICQADLALPFTQKFLEKLQEKNQAEGLNITACAGVAFVHSHFPFELAYDIAEQCCQNAKKEFYKDKEGSFLDFYLVRGSYVKTMDEQRKILDYLSKPYNIAELEKLIDLIYKLNRPLDKQDMTIWPRSRLIALYEAYLQNEEAVKLVKNEAESRGYVEIISDNRMLFDALQLIDCGKDKEWTSCQNTN